MQAVDAKFYLAEHLNYVLRWLFLRHYRADIAGISPPPKQ